MVDSRVGPLALCSPIARLLIGAALIVCLSAYVGRAARPTSAGVPPLHGDRDSAHVTRSGPQATIPDTVEWRFSEPQPTWKPELPLPGLRAVEVERTADALRMTLPQGSRLPGFNTFAGGIYVDLPDWPREEWTEVLVRARTISSVSSMVVGLNPREGVVPSCPACLWQRTFQALGGETPIVRDGLVHTYRIHLDRGSQRTGPWRRVGFQFGATAPGSIDILSVRVVRPAAGQDRVTETILEPPQLKSDFALFRKALEEAHPVLYRYTTKREMDAEFARAEAKLTRPMPILQFRNVLALVLAKIKDGHTGFTGYQGDEVSTVVGSAKQFPLALTFKSKRGFVVLNEGLDDRVKPGMEVLAINGQSLAEILRQILPNLTSDGDIHTWKMWQLGISRGFFERDQQGSPYRTGFSESYRLYIGNPARFRTTLRNPHTRKTVIVELPGVTIAEAAVNAEQNPVNRGVLTGLGTLRAQHPRNAIRYLDGEDTAILMPSWDRPNTPDFFKEAFAGLRSHGTKNLIVDMRGNTGGFDQYPTLLFSYLTSKDFRSSDPNYVKTYQPSFKQYTDLPEIDPVTDPYWGTAVGIWKPGPNGGWLMTEKYPIVGVHKPSENHFVGTVYVLIDGGSFSATSDFCATADFYKRATFIGEETGGAAQGDASGGDVGPTLPESHLHLEIPTEASFNVVDKSNRRRGTRPKYAVTQTIDDLARGHDTVLDFTRELIRGRRGR